MAQRNIASFKSLQCGAEFEVGHHAHRRGWPETTGTATKWMCRISCCSLHAHSRPPTISEIPFFVVKLDACTHHEWRAGFWKLLSSGSAVGLQSHVSFSDKLVDSGCLAECFLLDRQADQTTARPDVYRNGRLPVEGCSPKLAFQEPSMMPDEIRSTRVPQSGKM